jgi:hypothetical protein
MRKISCLFTIMAVIAAFPAAAMQKAGERTVSPGDLLGQLGDTLADPGLDPAIEAAAAHPLGTLLNPVRVGGPEGERAYIARLRCADGSRPKVGARSSAGVGAFGSLVARYSLDCGAAAPGRFDLVLDMYHEEYREARAPAGFTIDPA